jgi:hypothetical protein
MYRLPAPPRWPSAFGNTAPAAPRNDWEQTERILEILERDPLGPPGLQSRPPQGRPAPSLDARVDEWLNRPLRESTYLQAMGIRPDDPFWDTYPDPWRDNVAELLPAAAPGDDLRRPHFDPYGRPAEIVPFAADAAPAPSGGGDENDYGYGIPMPPPAPSAATPGDENDYGYGIPVPPPAPGGDEAPRTVAVPRHKSDREIADEVYATMRRNDAEKAAEPPPAPGASSRPAGIRISVYDGAIGLGHIGIGIDKGDGSDGDAVRFCSD